MSLDVHTHLQTLVGQDIRTLTGGRPTRVTARVIRADKAPLLVSALSPRGSGQIRASVDRTIRQWVDIDGTVDRTQKVSFLNDVSVEWKQSDLVLLDRFSLVSTWQT